MNPLTNVKNINKLNEIELARGTVDKKSWHDMYKESAWIFIGGLAYGLTEGDILSVFSQYGEIVNINLIRDSKTGKIKGFCFLCYANQKSTVLAVDNLNGIKLCGRTIRVDHVSNYKPPKEHENDDEVTKHLKSEGCAPKPIKIENTQTSNGSQVATVKKKSKKIKKEKKKHKKKRKHESKEEAHSSKEIKEEKVDPGYSKYEFPSKERVAKRKNRQRDSSDSESLSGNESSDSDSNKKKLSSFQHNVKQSKKDYKARYDNYSKSRDGASDARKTPRKERVESSSDSQDELDKHNQLKNQDFSRSSKSTFSQSSASDHNRKRNHPQEDHQKDQSASYDRRKGKYSSEPERLASKRHRHHSDSSSDSDVSDKPKLRVTEKDTERRKDRNKQEDLGKSYEGTHKRYESSHRHRKEADYEKHSRHERYH